MGHRIPSDIKHGRLTGEESEQIVVMAERGLSAGRIAQKLNRHPVTISYAMHRLGVRKLQLREFSYVRKGVLVKSFSREEDAFLSALRVQGFTTTTKIAELLTKRFGHKRSAHTVNVRLVLLSNLDEAA